MNIIMSKPDALIVALGRALEGETIGWFAPTRMESRADFETALLATTPGATIYSTNGVERIKTPTGGALRFFSTNGTGMRGMTLDRAYVPGDTHEDKLLEIIPCIATTTHRGITLY